MAEQLDQQITAKKWAEESSKQNAQALEDLAKKADAIEQEAAKQREGIEARRKGDMLASRARAVMAAGGGGVDEKIISGLMAEGEYADYSHRVFPSPRDVRFNEMEYAVPVEQGGDCLREIRAFIEANNVRVHFPLEYRMVAGDDIWLSPFYQRDSAGGVPGPTTNS